MKNPAPKPFRHGAEEVGEGSQPQPPAASRAFRGAGYKLGETEDDPVSVVQGKPLDSGKRQVWGNQLEVCDTYKGDFMEIICMNDFTNVWEIKTNSLSFEESKRYKKILETSLATD